MKKQPSILHLKQEEEILGIIRQSPFAYAGRGAFAVLWILVPFFFFFPLMRLGPFGFVIFIALAASGFLYAAREWTMWNHTMLIVTDQRVIDVEHQGFFEREIMDVELKLISKAGVLKRGRLKKLLRVGTVKVKLKKAQAFDIELDAVRNPEQARDLINDLLKSKKKKRKAKSNDE